MGLIEYQSHQKATSEILNLYQGGRLNLEPGFQRSSIWKTRERALLIDSVIRNYPLPSIFLYKRQKEGNIIYDVIDGKQRIESLLMYTGLMRGRFWARVQLPESDAPEWMNWAILNKRKQQYRLLDYRLQTIEVDGDWNEIVDLFVRINSTGRALTRQEVRNAKYLDSEFLKKARQLASRYCAYLQRAGVVSSQQVRRMKHIELMCELIYSGNAQDVVHKKKVLDEVMEADTLRARVLKKAVRATISGLNRLRRMFPRLSPSIRLHKMSDFYTLAVLIQKFDAEGLVLTDKRRNELAWDILVAFCVGVDQLSEASRKLEIKQLEPSQELCREYLQTVKEGVDSQVNRRKREQILRSLIGPLFEAKDRQRLFSPEQRRIIWNSTETRVCAHSNCGQELTWDDFHLDHIKPFSAGGLTQLENAALRCPKHNLEKGSHYATA